MVNYLEKIRLLEQDLNFNGIFINRSKIAELYNGFKKSSYAVRVEYVRNTIKTLEYRTQDIRKMFYN